MFIVADIVSLTNVRLTGSLFDEVQIYNTAMCTWLSQE